MLEQARQLTEQSHVCVGVRSQPQQQAHRVILHCGNLHVSAPILETNKEMFKQLHAHGMCMLLADMLEMTCTGCMCAGTCLLDMVKVAVLPWMYEDTACVSDTWSTC